MTTPWLCSVIVLSGSAALAQTTVSPTPPAASDAPKTISVTGCVASGSKSDTITLTHAMVLPFGSPAIAPEPISAAEPVAPVSPERSQVSAAPTQPRSGAQPEPAPRTSAIPGAVGTSGAIVGTAPAGSSASTMDGYRLSGVDMTSWIGRRVQIVGTVAPVNPALPPVAVDPDRSNIIAALPEIHVMSVQPVTGPCVK